MVSSRMTKFDKVTQVEEKRDSMGQPHPKPKGLGPQRPRNLWVILHVIVLYTGKKQQPNFAW